MVSFSDQVQVRILQSKLGEQYPLFQKIQKIKQYQGVQVRMPQDLVIK